jgi:hypothetical protein
VTGVSLLQEKAGTKTLMPLVISKMHHLSMHTHAVAYPDSDRRRFISSELLGIANITPIQKVQM